MPRVLSIQSHVVYGYVGNKSATFPLQLLGYDVDVLNTVQFSNHTGYGHLGGSKMDVDHLISCIDGLKVNGLLAYDALLTGYTPGPEGIDALMYSLNEVKAKNPNLIYLADPVMGDDGKLYVSEQVPPRYKELLKLATIATPNHFEAEILTGHSMRTIPEIGKCLQAFHDTYGLKHIVISSIAIPIAAVAGYDPLPPADSDGNVLICAGSTQGNKPWLIIFPKRPERYTGVGDLFAGLLLGRLISGTQVDLAHAVELALASTQGVLDETSSSPREECKSDSETSPQAVEARTSELKIISSRHHIENPTVKWKAISI